ncbi:MAG: DUF6775 family putative metallopeptidase [Nitrososphaera sp.]|uniref:DUF6775 family putative metallopeptidase n=1 Tax=Nitrososphaera sp. TaxID=1971748 RepID=UPI003D6ED1A8
MDFRHVHFYAHDSLPCIDRVVRQVAEVFPSCTLDVKEPLPLPDVDQARISDVKQPFERQPAEHQDFDLDGTQVALYDGFELQRLLAQEMTGSGDAHIVFTDLLACTFSEDDWRYHARTVVCGTPAIISTAGIIEAPARPREFYAPFADIQSLKRKHAGRFIDYGDERMADAAAGCAFQALFFFLTDGEPFCDSDGCRLFNAHWQKDLIRTQVENPALCPKHRSLAKKFNSRLAAEKRI